MSSNILAVFTHSLTVAALAFAAGPAIAQALLADLAGTYDGGQAEIGAALQLGEDGRFRYFMSYGAVDETAAGTWAADAGGIVLDSDPVSAPSFTLLDSKGGKSSVFDITLDVPGGMPLQFFAALVSLSDGTERLADFDSDGLHLKLGRGEVVTGAALQLPIYQVSSERFAVPPKIGTMHFRFEPGDLGTVDFDHQQLPQEDGAFLLSRYDRVLKFRKDEEPLDTSDPVDALAQVTGAWNYTGQDCDTDHYFAPPADLPGATLTLSPDYTYRLTRLGKETQGSFRLEPYEHLGGDYFLLMLEQAQLTFILNADRFESWSQDEVETQCTQLFERPGAKADD